MPRINISSETRARAKSLRNNMTRSERKVWLQLRALKSQGHKLSRQAPVGPYIVDFACLAKKLIIEIDGETHFVGSGPVKDRRRTAFLEQEGFSVLRFTNSEVTNNLDGVLRNILSELQKGAPQ